MSPAGQIRIIVVIRFMAAADTKRRQSNHSPQIEEAKGDIKMATADQVVKWLQIVDLGAKSSAYSHHVNAAHNALVSSTLAVVSGNGGEAPEHPTSPPGPSPSKSKSKE